MSLLVKPIGQSQVASGSAAAPTANQVLAQIQALPPGWYLVRVTTGATAAVAFQANLMLSIAGGGRISELGRLPSNLFATTVEFVTWIQGNMTVAVAVVVADPAATYSANALTVTPIAPPTEPGAES
jgi:hypothetical protein